MAGNRNLYLKLLRLFAEQQGAAVVQIESALAAGDATLAERLAHTLKGVGGNIGAKSVQTAAGELEKLIRGRAAVTEMESSRQRLAAVLDPLIAQLRSRLSSLTPVIPAPTTLAPPADFAQARAAAAELTRLLSEADPGSADFVEANGAALRPLFAGAAWPEFEKLVQGYAFADAQAHLERALNSQP